MPYRRRSYPRRRRNFRRRRPAYTTTGSALHLARQAVRGVYYLKGLVNSELHKHDVNTSGNIAATGTVIPLANVAIGDNDNDRTGNSIYVRSSELRMKLSRNPAVGNVSQLIRVSLIMDTQQIADTTPSFLDIYDANSPLSHLSVDTVGRFKILYTKVFMLDNIDTVCKYIRWYKKMRHHIRYNGSATTDIQKGGLYIVLVSDQSASGFPDYTLDHRLSFHDN